MKEFCESLITKTKGDNLGSKVTVSSDTKEHVIELIVDGNDMEFVYMNKKEAEQLIDLLKGAIKKL